MLYSLVMVLIIIVSILLVLIVLVQNSKGGGLASNFMASNQIIGVKRTTDFLEKATWSLALGLLALSLIAGMTVPRGGKVEQRSKLENQAPNTESAGAQNAPTQEQPAPAAPQQ